MISWLMLAQASALGLIGAAVAVVGLGLLFGAGAEWLRIQSGWPVGWVLGDAIPGVLLFAAGFLAWGRRPGNPIGALMIAAGVHCATSAAASTRRSIRRGCGRRSAPARS